MRVADESVAAGSRTKAWQQGRGRERGLERGMRVAVFEGSRTGAWQTGRGLLKFVGARQE